MKTAKYKTNDRVTIVSNSLQPQYEGKVGKIKKVYASFQRERCGWTWVLLSSLETNKAGKKEEDKNGKGKDNYKLKLEDTAPSKYNRLVTIQAVEEGVAHLTKGYNDGEYYLITTEPDGKKPEKIKNNKSCRTNKTKRLF